MTNLLERALWTGMQTGLAILSVEALTPMDASATQLLLTAGIATALSALKTFSQERLAQISG
jgi:hypothetical protein